MLLIYKHYLICGKASDSAGSFSWSFENAKMLFLGKELLHLKSENILSKMICLEMCLIYDYDYILMFNSSSSLLLSSSFYLNTTEIAFDTSASLEDLQSEIDSLQEIFPDCDPNYIYHRLEGAKHRKDRVKMIAEDMFERKDYPRLKDLVEKQTKQSHKQRLQRLDFTVEVSIFLLGYLFHILREHEKI